MPGSGLLATCHVDVQRREVRNDSWPDPLDVIISRQTYQGAHPSELTTIDYFEAASAGPHADVGR